MSILFMQNFIFGANACIDTDNALQNKAVLLNW